jgi:hypothetical protein
MASALVPWIRRLESVPVLSSTMKRVLQPVDPAPFGSKQADCVPVPHTHAVAATVWIRVAIAAQSVMLIYFTVDNHIDLYPWNNLRGPCAELPSTHDDFTWYHDHGYAETLKVLAPIGERRPPAHGLATALSLSVSLSAGDCNGDNRLLQDLAADIRRVVSTEESRMMTVTCPTALSISRCLYCPARLSAVSTAHRCTFLKSPYGKR